VILFSLLVFMDITEADDTFDLEEQCQESTFSQASSQDAKDMNESRNLEFILKSLVSGGKH